MDTECDLCGKSADGKARFHCPTCARMAIYPLRLEQAAILLEKEAMGRRVEAAVQAGDSKIPRESLTLSGKIIDTHDCAKASEMDRIASESAELKERVGLINDRAQALQSEMEDYRKSLKARKTEISQRRSDAESATFGLEEREAKEVEATVASIRRTRRRWEMNHSAIVEGRADLCRPAARLAGLRRHRRPREDGSVREYYTIGTGVSIYDLRELHTANPEELTASLTHLAYLTAKAANYLALRLPAEITLPHKDYPLPTIFAPQSSYFARDVPFPGNTPTTSSSSSPVASRTFDSRPMPTPRPLFIRVSLQKLSKDDSKTYAMFIEGVTLLAWDIAWLCKTQGMVVDSESELYAMGRNLWNLLLADNVDNPASHEVESSARRTDTRTPAKIPPENPPTRFGQLSHGTAHSFFDSSEGKQLMREWRLQTPMRSILKIKEYLNNEMQKSEWEVVQEAEWDTGAAVEDEAPILVGGKRYSSEQKNSTTRGKPPSTSSVAVAGGSDTSNLKISDNRRVFDVVPPPGPSASGTNQGWTKLRTRSTITDQRS